MAVIQAIPVASSVVREHWALLLVAFFVLRALKRRYISPISDVPALNFLSTISRLGKVREVRSGQTEKNLLKAHRKYGSMVRIGPNEVSVSDPAYIPIIYDTAQRFTKTDFYMVWGFPTPADKNSFSETNPQEHFRMRKNIALAYSMTAAVGLERFVDSTVKVLLSRLEELSVAPGTGVSSRGSAVNIVKWFQWYVFDVIGELSFSQRFGFLDTKSDVGGTCNLIQTLIGYTSSVAMVPEMHKYLLGNPLLKYVVTPPASIIADLATSVIENRDKNPDVTHEDIVEKFMRSQRSTPETFPHEEIVRHSSLNITAGSDTTGITLDALLYYLLKNPHCYEKLQAEVDKANQAGKLSEYPKFSETNHEAMPYLAACIQEAFRIHPPVALTLPRHVPAGGVELCGRFLPEGTRVGISPFVVARDKIFGDDVDVFRPERWIECSPEKFRAMENSCTHFSYGSRQCPGRYIAMLEMCKMFPALMRKFRMELANPAEEWELMNYTFLKPKAINIWLVRR